MTTMVIHPGAGSRICYTRTFSAPWWETPHCTTCTCEQDVKKPEHGRWVTCGGCGETGIVPDAGHETDFLPPGSSMEDGRITIRFGSYR
jgi:hypothetical protein